MRQYFLVVITILVLLITAAFPAGAAGLTWSGSLETGPEYYSGTTETILDNDLRLKLDLNLGQTLSGVLLLQYQAQIPDSDRNPDGNRMSVNQAYLDLKLPADSLLRAGRQKISWGSGFAWNPTNDIGADKNRADLANELPGVDIIDFEKAFGESALVVVLKPQPTPNDWGKAVKYATRLGHHDLALSAYQKGPVNAFGIDWAASIGDYTVYSEIASKAGTERFYVGENAGLLVPLARPVNERYLHGVVGLGRMLPNDWMYQVEYYYNQEGWSAAEADNFHNYSGAVAFQAATYFGDLRRNYLYALIRKGEVITDLTAALSFLGNLDDGSMMIAPVLEYRLGTNTMANLTITWFTGNAATEFGSLPDRLQISAKVTFSF